MNINDIMTTLNVSNLPDFLSSTEATRPEVDTRVYNFVLYSLFYYAVFILCGIGLITNILVMLTMLSSTKLRSNSGGTLILTLAFVDCSLIVSLAVDWYDFYYKVIKDFIHCLVFAYYWHIVRSLSHLIVMLVSINRFALVCYPFTHRRVTSRKSSLFQLLGITIFSSLGSIYIFFTHDPDAEFCTLNKATINIYYISFSAIDTICSNIVPLLVTFILTSKVLRCLAQNKEVLGTGTQASTKSSSKQNMEKNLTKALIAVNVSFLVLSLPHITVYTATFLHSFLVGPSNQTHINLTTAWQVLYLVENINYVINMFLYCWYSTVFRKSLVNLLRCKCRGSSSSSPRDEVGLSVTAASKYL